MVFFAFSFRPAVNPARVLVYLKVTRVLILPVSTTTEDANLLDMLVKSPSIRTALVRLSDGPS